MKPFGVLFLVVVLGLFQAEALTAGFIKSPLSQMKLTEDGAELDCEVIGNPIPEIQWWFIEGEEPDEIITQLFDGARGDRVRINATYINHATSTLVLGNLTLNDTGIYECRASNDPDRNDLWTPPKVKWIRSQANVIVFEHPHIDAKMSQATNMTSATLTCNFTDLSIKLHGYSWVKNGKTIVNNQSHPLYIIQHNITKVDYTSAGEYVCVFNSTVQYNATIEVYAPPHAVAPKHSENANENDQGALVCLGQGYPLPTDWNWYRLSDGDDSERVRLANGTDGKYEIKSTPEKTTLYIKDLDINKDQASYQCEATNEYGMVSDEILLRVRSKLAALWPFLGIVAEVIILITIIFIYEKRRKPDEINDDDDSGSAPLKSNSATNHKDKNVRQRNSN